MTAPATDAIRARLGHRRLPALAAVLAVALCLPAVRAGLQGDDHFHRLVLDGAGIHGQGAEPLWDLFVFLPGGETGAAG